MLLKSLFAALSKHAKALALGLALMLAAACATVEPSAPRIIAVGDLHGDYAAFEQVMTRAGLMNGAGDWTGGDAILIQNGDIAGRGPDTRRIVAGLKKLQAQAPERGGEVIVLVGNHEAMQMTGDLRYVHPGEIEAFRTGTSGAAREAAFAANREAILAAYRRGDGADLSEDNIRTQWMAATPLGFAEYRAAWAPDGEIGAWVAGNRAAVIFGDTAFVHGGLSAKYAQYSVSELNDMTRAALLALSRDRAAIIHDSVGPMWHRGLVRPANGAALTIEEELDIVLSAYGVKRIVIGHTPNLAGVKPNHNARVIQIDTGMSAHYGGAISFLEITKDGLFANNDGVTTRIEE